MDLAAYSDIATVLEEHLDVRAVKSFEDRIQSFADVGLKQLGLRRDDVVFATAGDNTLLIFDDPTTMHEFARIVQEAALNHNRKKSVESAKRWFRMGAATGVVMVIAEERRIVGTTVARAVRLEAAAETGELLIDTETYEALPEEIRKLYGEKEVVPGKRNEQFAVRRCVFIPRADCLGQVFAHPKSITPDNGIKIKSADTDLDEVNNLNHRKEPVCAACAVCGKSYRSRLSLRHTCNQCDMPICVDCWFSKKVRTCSKHGGEKDVKAALK